jgi:hypothetical protein
MGLSTKDRSKQIRRSGFLGKTVELWGGSSATPRSSGAAQAESGPARALKFRAEPTALRQAPAPSQEVDPV